MSGDSQLTPPGSLLPPSGAALSGPTTSEPAFAAAGAPATQVPPAATPNGPRPWLWVHTAHPNPVTRGEAPGEPTASATTFPPQWRTHPAPRGLDIVGGRRVGLDGAVTLDRVASGHGALTISWSHEDADCDLLGFADGTVVEARGRDLVVDLVPGVRRVLVATGTRGQRQLPSSRLLVTNGDTVVELRLPGGTSYGVWPRLSLIGVDEFVVLIDEADPGSGGYEQVARSYAFDPESIVRAGR